MAVEGKLANSRPPSVSTTAGRPGRDLGHGSFLCQFHCMRSGFLGAQVHLERLSLNLHKIGLG